MKIRGRTMMAGGLLAISALVGAGLYGATETLHAQEATHTFTASNQEINDSGASADVTITASGSSISVMIDATGLAPGAPHAQHIHVGGQAQCPAMSADSDGDGLVSTAEGQPFYGGVRVSLTTEGDVSADSALAVDRFPVADDAGNVRYERTFELPDGVNAEDVANAVVVQHGIDLDDSGQYDGDAPSSLDPSLPLEATIPANCGELTATQMQPPSTGNGGLAATDDGTSIYIMVLAIGGFAAVFGVLAARHAALARRR